MNVVLVYLMNKIFILEISQILVFDYAHCNIVFKCPCHPAIPFRKMLFKHILHLF